MVRDLLLASERFQSLDPETRKTIASSLVRISDLAVKLAEQGEGSRARPAPAALGLAAAPPLARAQDAGSSFSGVATDRIAGTTRQILDAVSFPRFVTELINGVFKALNDSNQQQLSSYVELIRNVAASTEGFADANVGDAGARQWLAERFPGSFIIAGDEDDGFDDPATMNPEERREWQAERDASTRLRLRPNAAMPSEAALRTALGLGPQDSVPSGDPENLVGLARGALARQRQQMLSSMVMMGLQRLVIDSGRLNASMRFHIDTRSAAADDRGSSFDLRNQVDASGKFGFGPWGAEAHVQNTIGYVTTEQTQTTEEMNTSVDLNSSVELIFHTDYVPLARLAGGGDIDRIRVNALNPTEESRIAADEEKARRASQQQGEEARRGGLSQRLQRPPDIPQRPAPQPPAAPPAQRPAEQRTPAGQQTSGGRQAPTGTPAQPASPAQGGTAQPALRTAA
jgi:hypothetical protein